MQVLNAGSVLLSAFTFISSGIKVNVRKKSQRHCLIVSVSNLVQLFCLNRSLISVLQEGNNAHFVSASSVLSSGVTVTSPVTKINASK